MLCCVHHCLITSWKFKAKDLKDFKAPHPLEFPVFSVGMVWIFSWNYTLKVESGAYLPPHDCNPNTNNALAKG